MKIDIAHIAKLSRLHFEPEQIAKFEKDMESIVAMVDHLPDVSDTLTVDPNNAMRLREDVAKDHKFKREEMLANAPEVQAVANNDLLMRLYIHTFHILYPTDTHRMFC